MSGARHVLLWLRFVAVLPWLLARAWLDVWRYPKRDDRR